MCLTDGGNTLGAFTTSPAEWQVFLNVHTQILSHVYDDYIATTTYTNLTYKACTRVKSAKKGRRGPTTATALRTHKPIYLRVQAVVAVAASTCARDKSVICKLPGAKLWPRKLENQTSSCAAKRLDGLLNHAAFSTLYTYNIYIYILNACVCTI